METFEAFIKDYLRDKYKKKADELYSLSYILQYLVYKTKSANKGAKARGSFANLYWQILFCKQDTAKYS